MTNYQMYKAMEGKTLHLKGCSHPTIVQDVGNDTPVEIVVEDGYFKYKGQPFRVSSKGVLSFYLDYLREYDLKEYSRYYQLNDEQKKRLAKQLQGEK